MRHVLMDMFILEIDAGQKYPFCMSGSRLNALFTAELKGRSFLSLWPDAQKPEIEAMIQTVTDDVLPIVGGAEASPPDYDRTLFELLLLPLRHHGKTHSRLLGCMAPASHPVWLGLLPIHTLNFKSMRILDAQHSGAAGRPGSPSFGRSADRPFEQRGHLRVYNSQD